MTHLPGTSARRPLCRHTAKLSSVRPILHDILIDMWMTGDLSTPIANRNWPERTLPFVLALGE
jgi:hypothetical protein